MKRKYLQWGVSIVAAFLMVGMLSGCDTDLVGINTNPNATLEERLLREEGMRAQVIALQVTTGDWYPDERSRISSVWTLHMCAPPGLGRPQPVAWNTYKQVRDETPDRAWIQAYRVVKIANDLIKNVPQVSFPATAAVEGARMTRLTRNTMLGMAKFFKALALGETAAFYGDIPIDVAGGPEEPPPVYVKQSAAYAHVQGLLDEALAHFSDSTIVLNEDLNFRGVAAVNSVSLVHRERWIRAAHSLKARFFLHVRNYAKALEHSGGVATNGIALAGGTVNSIYTASSGEWAPWHHWAVGETGEPLRAAKYIVDLLRSETGDTRLAGYFVVRGGAAAIVGFDVHRELGGTGDELIETRAAGLVKYNPSSRPFPLMSFEETVLIRAEARARGGDLGGAVADLNTIRTAAGLPARTVAFFAGDATAIIHEILKQKYIQLHLEGQAYHDMRRVERHHGPVTAAMRRNGIALPRPAVPLRFIYGQNEFSVNPNVPKPEPALNEVL